MDQIAAVLCPEEPPFSNPIVTDIGNILLQLSEAVAEAKGEAERERAKRLTLERENEEMRAQRFALAETVSSLEDDSTLSGQNRIVNLSSPLTGSVIETSFNLNDCLAYVCSMSVNQDLVYMSYQKAGLADLDLTKVERILQPYDCSSLMFIVFTTCKNTFISSHLLPFGLETLQLLLASPRAPTLLAGQLSPINSTSSLEDPPRMNLLEALNVQSDSDCQRIITVRKCHKLGFKSHVHLRQYFSKFGRVERVVLLPMRAKPKNTMEGRGSRPSSMGFVVMESRDVVEAVLGFNNACGIHEIKGWPIEVRNFVKPIDKPDREVSGTTMTSELGAAWSVVHNPAFLNEGIFEW